METTIEINGTHSTQVTLEMTSVEKHTHDDIIGDKRKPFRVAYIHMLTDLGEKYSGRVEEDKMTALVNIDLIDGYSPKLVFDLVDVDGTTADNVNTYFHEVWYIEQVLEELADAIRYHEI